MGQARALGHRGRYQVARLRACGDRAQRSALPPQVPRSSPLEVGDMVALGISHPCTTFDKWQVLCIVNGDYDIVSAVRTFF